MVSTISKKKFEMPGIFGHFVLTFKMVFGNYKVFLPLFILAVLVMFLVVGFPTLETVVTTSFVGLSLWLTTIFLVRHIKAKQEVTLRDALYNALTPLISSLVVFIVGAVQSLPVIFLVIAYSSAVETNFLSTPFYALVFLVFAVLMILLSGYLLSSTLVAFVAVSAPGLYPARALKIAGELMKGRRIKFCIRVVALLILLGIIWLAIMAPAVLIAQQVGWINVSLFAEGMATILGCFTIIIVATYLYLYYRWMIDYDNK